MEKLYCKWVSDDLTTMNDTKWEINIPKEFPVPKRDDLELCPEVFFHYFCHPLLAVMFKEKYGCESYSKLYEVSPGGKILEYLHHYFGSSTKLTLIKELEIPNVNDIQKIAFGILCVLKVYKDPKFVSWANNWLSGEDRSNQAAELVIASVNDAFAAANVTEFWTVDKAASCVALDVVKAAANVVVKDAIDSAFSAFTVHGFINKIGFTIVSKNPKKQLDLVSIAKKAMEIQ